MIVLKAYSQELHILPHIGAAIAAYRVEHEGQAVDFLRPATAQAIAQGTISEMSSFLMAPWAGRIQHGRFTYQGQAIHYPSRIEGLPHSMHGFTRDLPWQVVEQTTDNVSLRFTYQATAEWPFSFTILQGYTLTEKGLLIEVEAENTGETVMPFSMGHHPFFPADAQTKIYANVKKAWFSDESLMPTHLDDHPLVERLAVGYPVQEAAWDTIFTGWDRVAIVEWANRRLRYTVSHPMDFFVLYNPQGEAWFCAEPFGNITDSFNLREQFPRMDIGGLDLAVGEQVKAQFYLEPYFYY